MRRGLSFVLVMLLVLRGLLGDAMAMGTAPVLAPTEPAHHQASADTGSALNARMDPQTSPDGCVHADHPGHKVQVATTCTAFKTSAGSDCSHEHGPTCSTCNICHSALFTPDLPVPPQALASAALRPLGGERFVSAPAALLIKPPIS